MENRGELCVDMFLITEAYLHTSGGAAGLIHRVTDFWVQHVHTSPEGLNIITYLCKRLRSWRPLLLSSILGTFRTAGQRDAGVCNSGHMQPACRSDWRSHMNSLQSARLLQTKCYKSALFLLCTLDNGQDSDVNTAAATSTGGSPCGGQPPSSHRVFSGFYSYMNPSTIT